MCKSININLKLTKRMTLACCSADYVFGISFSKLQRASRNQRTVWSQGPRLVIHGAPGFELIINATSYVSGKSNEWQTLSIIVSKPAF